MLKRQKSRGEGGRAFTLVQLLVTLAIVAVAVAVLLPALSAARGVAREARCTSNFRQLGVAGAAYAADHGLRIRGMVTVSNARKTTGRPRDSRWYLGLGEYLGAPTVTTTFRGSRRARFASPALCEAVLALNCPAMDPDDGYEVVESNRDTAGGTVSAVNRIF